MHLFSTTDKAEMIKDQNNNIMKVCIRENFKVRRLVEKSFLKHSIHAPEFVGQRYPSYRGFSSAYSEL
jgi:hypothetical protein